MFSRRRRRSRMTVTMKMNTNSDMKMKRKQKMMMTTAPTLCGLNSLSPRNSSSQFIYRI